jgi:alkylation response protein AidB-like acyl-CoA dehydrogenase
MDLTFGKDEIAFQQEVRAWLKDNLTPELMGEMKAGRNAYLSKERLVDWQKRLAKKGWLCTGWPKEFGGPGFTTTQKYIFEMEMARAGAPGTSPFGPKMCAPVIMKYGSPEQKTRHLPPMLNSDLIWCQGYSEPGSGSDLASLRTKAVRHKDESGDHYIVNGQKTWTTLAQTADWIFCLVRTSNEGKPQEGISFLLIDMKTPGISVEPIITADGNRAGTQEVNSVFFTDVKVPVENRVGEENKGWTYAKYLLEFERGGNPYSPRLRSAFDKLMRLAKSMPDGDASILSDIAWREKLARTDIEISGLEMFEQEFYSRLASGQNPGPLSSMIKLRGTEVMQQVQEFAVEAAANYAMPFPEQRTWNSNVEPIGPEGVDVLAPRYFNGRKMTIYGGSSEVQRGIMSKVMLGL